MLNLRRLSSVLTNTVRIITISVRSKDMSRIVRLRMAGAEANTMSDEAILSSADGYTVFRYDDYVIRFVAPYSLEKYISIKEWDAGYIVVMTKYRHKDDYVEEYIDLIPVLENLYMDKDSFLKPIKKVRVSYD